MRAATHLLIIDPQNDFCDLPTSYLGIGPSGGLLKPALPVAGAHADMQRLAGFIDAAADRLDAISVTLDSHQHIDIAHPTFWQQADGSPVAPFTAITAEALRSGAFRPRDVSALARAQAYVDELEARGRYTLMIWPVHCEIGSWGHNVHADLLAAYNRWEERRLRSVAKIGKGENPWTEHYSAIQAEVPLADDVRTQMNRSLIETLNLAELLLIAGEASSHCVRATTEHLADYLPNACLSRVVLLTDCMSPVAGFEAQHLEFLADMRERGLQLATSAQALALVAERCTRTIAP